MTTDRKRLAAPRRKGEAGQAIVLMLGVILASVAMVGLIVDGGNVVSQQRIVQAGSDATAEAGAVLLAHRLSGADMPTGGWDAVIAAKLAETAAANNMTVGAAYYTDICGIPLKFDGTAALTADFHEDLASALEVGNAFNSLPAAGMTTPDCPNHVVGPVAGVMVLGEKIVPSFVARAINIATFTVSTRATAVAGYLQGYCDASQGNYCGLLPIAIPVNVMGCNGNNSPVDTGVEWTWNTLTKIPLCSTADGNVGWIDWDPVSGGVGDVACSIITPDNPSIDLPSWQYVAQSGNSNGGGGDCAQTLEEAVRTHNGETILVPQFDLTCGTNVAAGDPDSSEPAVVTPPNYGCPVDVGSGGGSNLWYRFPSFAFFELCAPGLSGCGGLQSAYIGGNNGNICDTGNGATSCLVGRFVNILATGTVGAGVGSGTGNKALGVQLIK